MFVNPSDALTDPIKYWSDVMTMQFEMSVAFYEAAAQMNPFLQPLHVAAPAPRPRAKTAKPAPRRAAARKTAPAKPKLVAE
ncbi:MAG: hypothetical protein EX266_15860, partial [Rhodobacteraceae bacterium]